MRDPVFPVFCALAIVLCILPLPKFWKARNVGALLYIGWTEVGCIIYFVNSLVWAGNLRNPAPVWCDISTKLIIGLSVGITASSLCINRHLYYITTVHKRGSISPSEKRRTMILDLSFGIGLPVLVMALHYIVHDHRFDILEDYGCWPVIYNTLLAIPLVMIWPIGISVASLIYAGLTICALLQYRTALDGTLSKSGGGLTKGTYFRLMALASTEILFSLPFSLFILINNVSSSSSLNPWISFADTHSGFSRINFIPFVFINSQPTTRALVEISRWVTPAGGIYFFMYLGVPREARTEYLKVFWWAVKPLGFKPRARAQSSTWSNRLASNASVTTPNMPSRPTVNVALSSTIVTTDDKFEVTAIKHNVLVDKSHDLEAQK
ncbi:a-factor receptor [Ceratobasidium sp. 394]|nr:a-factor receptor [Ceratobasidium sp. 394]